MTIEEAIEMCEKLHKLFSVANEAGEELVAIKNIPVEYLGFAIEALEKQIPKKPYDVTEKEYDDFYYLGFICPSCNEAAVYQPYRPKFCKHCGQRIDWSVEE